MRSAGITDGPSTALVEVAPRGLGARGCRVEAGSGYDDRSSVARALLPQRARTRPPGPATSCKAVPVLSKMMISSGDVRPAARRLRSHPARHARRRVSSHRRRAPGKIAIVAHCSRTSVMTTFSASKLGSISASRGCPRRPQQRTNGSTSPAAESPVATSCTSHKCRVPSRESEIVHRAYRDAELARHRVCIRLARSATTSTRRRSECPRRTRSPEAGRAFETTTHRRDAAASAIARYRAATAVAAAVADAGDLPRIDQSEWTTILGVEEGNDTLNGRQPEALAISREVCVDLRHEVRAIAGGEATRLDVEGSTIDVRAEHSWCDGAPFGVHPERTLDGVDALVHREQIDDITSREHERAGGHPVGQLIIGATVSRPFGGGQVLTGRRIFSDHMRAVHARDSSQRTRSHVKRPDRQRQRRASHHRPMVGLR